jgi:hypothetical protein
MVNYTVAIIMIWCPDAVQSEVLVYVVGYPLQRKRS